jgi:FKBP-type peptidyl-prolyl cis-trans isomerase SlpA
MSVKEGDIVKIRYTEKTEKGKILFSNKNEEPIEVKVGDGFVVKGLEEGLIGMKKGDQKDITVAPEKGYGYHNEERIKTFTRGYREERIREGDEYLYYDYLSKRPVKGTIVEVRPKVFIVDFNHKLCNKTLRYSVEVVGIEKSTPPQYT